MQAEAGFVSLITFYETRLKLLSSCSVAQEHNHFIKFQTAADKHSIPGLNT
jgi:hypothetical protein